jgi:rubrerythrin
MDLNIGQDSWNIGMTKFLKPSIKVNQLRVFQGGHVAFDAEFHAGVNFIRGRNSSGKTTVMDFLAYALGAENIRWKKEALLCTDVLIEVEFNKNAITLRREISEETKRPMSIYWGKLEKALSAGPQQWELYPFTRSVHRLSFSQIIIEALDMPQAQGDGASNLTIHQLLRVIYADQPSVHSPIFRLDSYDTALIRETVGGYLCGVYDDDLYSAQLRLREISAQLAKQEAELRSIYHVLGRSGQSSILEFVNAQIQDLEINRDQQLLELVQLKKTRTLLSEDSKAIKKNDEKLRQKLDTLRKYEFEKKQQLASLELEQADSALFVEELRARLASLDDSSVTRNYLGNLKFYFCPSCLTSLEGKQNLPGHCGLCSSVEKEGYVESQALRLRNEISVQLKESAGLVQLREAEISNIKRVLPQLSADVRKLEREFQAAGETWSSEVETAIEQSSRRLGALDEEIKQAYEKQRLAAIVAELQAKRNTLRDEESQLNDRIIALGAKQTKRKEQVADTVATNAMRLLKLDLPRQKEFMSPDSFSYDFVENSVYVNGARNFSESSAVVLRHLFHLALLTTSTQLEFMRFPRFLILDGIDDGGMEKIRSHRLQEIIVDECKSYDVDFQLICATSEINPNFNIDGFVVGEYFTTDVPSLDVRPSME